MILTLFKDSEYSKQICGKIFVHKVNETAVHYQKIIGKILNFNPLKKGPFK